MILISNIYISYFHTNYYQSYEVMILMVAKSVSMDLNDLNKIQEKIENGESASLSEFVRNAIKNELKE